MSSLSSSVSRKPTYLSETPWSKDLSTNFTNAVIPSPLLFSLRSMLFISSNVTTPLANNWQRMDFIGSLQNCSNWPRRFFKATEQSTESVITKFNYWCCGVMDKLVSMPIIFANYHNYYNYDYEVGAIVDICDLVWQKGLIAFQIV